jgi:hypothetical protein
MNPRLFGIKSHCSTLTALSQPTKEKKAIVYRKEIRKFYLARHQALKMKTKVAFADEFYSPVSHVDLSVLWIRITLMRI